MLLNPDQRIAVLVLVVLELELSLELVPDKGIPAFTAIQHIGQAVVTAVQLIIFRATIQVIQAALSAEGVHALVAAEHVIASAPLNDIVAPLTKDAVVF